MSTTPKTPAQARNDWLRHGSRGAQPAPARNSTLAQIHIAKKDLALDDTTYRAMLWTVARVKSAAELDHAGREAVLAHLRARGWKPAPRKPAATSPNAGAPHNLHSAARGPQLQKIGALLASAQRPWAYGHSMARRMFGLANLALANEAQLQKLIAALEIDRARRAKKEPANG